jgi:hypothetical protein
MSPHIVRVSFFGMNYHFINTTKRVAECLLSTKVSFSVREKLVSQDCYTIFDSPAGKVSIAKARRNI